MVSHPFHTVSPSEQMLTFAKGPNYMKFYSNLPKVFIHERNRKRKFAKCWPFSLMPEYLIIAKSFYLYVLSFSTLQHWKSSKNHVVGNKFTWDIDIYITWLILSQIFTKDPIAHLLGWGMRCLFVDLAYGWHSASIPAIIYAISLNFGPRNNGTQLFYHWINQSLLHLVDKCFLVISNVWLWYVVVLCIVCCHLLTIWDLGVYTLPTTLLLRGLSGLPFGTHSSIQVWEHIHVTAGMTHATNGYS